MRMVRPDRTRSDGAAQRHGSGLDHRALAITFAVFAAFAGLVAVVSGGNDGSWGAWAVGGYAVTAIAVWRWPNSLAALAPALLLGLVAPLAWLAIRAPMTPDVTVVTNSARQLLHHGSPYLSSAQLAHRGVLAYNPYLPVMSAFGLPKAAGLPGLLGDPRPWLAVASLAVLAVAFGLCMPHRVSGCAACRGSAVRYAVLAVASPLLALSLAVGITDPPVLALMCLVLALTARRSQPALAGLVIGVACAMKSIAWLALPVIAALLASRDGARAAARFCIASVIAAVTLVVAMAPALLIRPSGFLENTVLFPLGATPQHTPAASPLPGHLLADTGSAGHAAAIGLLVIVALAFAASLVVRPPADTRAATWRLAIGLSLFFALAPDARFGYFAYPGALLGWLAITARAQGADHQPTGRVAAGVTTASAAETSAAHVPAETPTPAETAAVSPETVPPGRQAERLAARPVSMPGLAAAKVWVIRIWLRWRRRPAADNLSGGS